ncbi:hypothetical protein JOQ06_003134 [Pogonophryne albipinna]|uniref:Uncharacterized protein n=1 Tax=Pogonophryne albipinna TaxID=1090488 RepID=A0AAD6FKB7_9TELE|nr:hypothetical protein JOQ06_003134 [Pogonophryne albipinna]
MAGGFSMEYPDEMPPFMSVQHLSTISNKIMLCSSAQLLLRVLESKFTMEVGIRHYTDTAPVGTTPSCKVQTIRGRKICYSGTFRWAVDVYNLLHNTEGSTQP